MDSCEHGKEIYINLKDMNCLDQLSDFELNKNDSSLRREKFRS
jgi:hypothetical protein